MQSSTFSSVLFRANCFYFQQKANVLPNKGQTTINWLRSYYRNNGEGFRAHAYEHSATHLREIAYTNRPHTLFADRPNINRNGIIKVDSSNGGRWIIFGSWKLLYTSS